MKRLEALRVFTAPLSLHIPTIATPIGYRLVELALGGDDALIDYEEIETLLKVASPPLAEKLLILLMEQDKIELLQGGKGAVSYQTSPLPSPERVTSVAEDNSTGEDNSNSNADGTGATAQSTGESGVGSSEPKRTRKPPAVYDAETPAATAGNKKQKVAEKTGGTDSIPLDEKGKKRKYMRSGLYSRDPMKAAAARATINLAGAHMNHSLALCTCTAIRHPFLPLPSDLQFICFEFVLCAQLLPLLLLCRETSRRSKTCRLR